MIARACRIYDKNTKQMLYPEQLMRMGVFVDPQGVPVQVKHHWLRTVVKQLKNVVVMYASGLKTDDGKPIWEGDILDVAVLNEWGSCISARGFMTWDSHNAKWFVHIPKPPALVPQGADIQLAGAKALGDIYQTPHLLNHPA